MSCCFLLQPTTAKEGGRVAAGRGAAGSDAAAKQKSRVPIWLFL